MITKQKILEKIKEKINKTFFNSIRKIKVEENGETISNDKIVLENFQQLVDIIFNKIEKSNFTDFSIDYFSETDTLGIYFNKNGKILKIIYVE